MKYECEDCGSLFNKDEVRSWLDITTGKVVDKKPYCPFCDSRWTKLKGVCYNDKLLLVCEGLF